MNNLKQKGGVIQNDSKTVSETFTRGDIASLNINDMSNNNIFNQYLSLGGQLSPHGFEIEDLHS